MKYIRTYENIVEEPQIGDYVLCNDASSDDGEDINNFIKSNVGQFITYTEEDDHCDEELFPYMIKYENFPPSIRGQFQSSSHMSNCRSMSRAEIIFHSPDREEVEAYLKARDFDL